jgi:predicted nucleic acid-binding protein
MRQPGVLREVGDVLRRPVLQRKFPLLTPERVDSFLRQVSVRAAMFTQVPHCFSLPRDPKDEPYLDLAITAGAHYLVTWNRKHLTYLMDRKTPEGKDFCGRYPDIRILAPPEFLQDLRRRFGPAA